MQTFMKSGSAGSAVARSDGGALASTAFMVLKARSHGVLPWTDWAMASSLWNAASISACVVAWSAGPPAAGGLASASAGLGASGVAAAGAAGVAGVADAAFAAVGDAGGAGAGACAGASAAPDDA